MMADDAALAVIEALEAMAIPYMVVGSLSVNCYAAPRSTQDADFVLQMAGREIGEVVRRLGPNFCLDPQRGFETVTATLRYRLAVVGTRFKIELFTLSDDPHDMARFERRVRVEVMGHAASVPTPEDVVIMKLRWSKGGKRSKDVSDALNVIKWQRDRLDWDYVNTWCDRHGTRALLDELRASVGA